MSNNPYAPPFSDLPDILPIFPLTGVLLLPFGELPLNIFEPRYLEMINRALAGNRMIGMVQTKDKTPQIPIIYETGCAGKITEFHETSDGRYIITLTGISRFIIKKELSTTTPYRQIIPNWSSFENDMVAADCLDIDRERLTQMLQSYFAKQQLNCDWTKINEASDGRLITCLSMICPFTPQEKQALLEAKCCKTRADIFMTMLEMGMHSDKDQTANH